MPERTSDAAASEPEHRTPETTPPTPSPEAARSAVAPSEPTTDAPEPASSKGDMPDYKGEPLDAERGPGLGCFWIQIALLTFFLIFTPLTVTWGWDPFISGVLLIFTLILLLFSGQTIIFLLRLVAADRRARRTPLSPSAKPTVGQMEDADPVPSADATPPVVRGTASAADGERHDPGGTRPSTGGTQPKGED